MNRHRTAEPQADSERLRAWEKADRDRELRLWNELNADLRENAAAQARFNQKVKATLAVLVLIIASVVLMLRALSQ